MIMVNLVLFDELKSALKDIQQGADEVRGYL